MRQRGIVNMQKMIRDRRAAACGSTPPTERSATSAASAYASGVPPTASPRRSWPLKCSFHGLQLGQMAISRIETGKRVVTDFELKLFSSVLGLSMDDLTAGDPSPVSSDPPRR